MQWRVLALCLLGAAVAVAAAASEEGAGVAVGMKAETLEDLTAMKEQLALLEAAAEAQAEGETQTDADADADAEDEGEADADADADAEDEGEADAEADAESESDAESEAVAESDAERRRGGGGGGGRVWRGGGGGGGGRVWWRGGGGGGGGRVWRRGGGGYGGRRGGGGGRRGGRCGRKCRRRRKRACRARGMVWARRGRGRRGRRYRWRWHGGWGCSGGGGGGGGGGSSSAGGDGAAQPMLGGGGGGGAPKSPLEAAASYGLRPRKEGTATSCVDAQLRGVKNIAGSTGSGTYRIDDGWFVRNLYCDMETNGGGWTLVANVASEGAWPNVNGDLESGFSDGNYPSTGDVWGEEARRKSFFTHFSWIPHEEVLFRTGNGAAWAVVEYNALNPRFKPSSAAPNMRVVAQHGTHVPAGGYTNRLMRPQNPEDPWIGFGGDHGANTRIMFYGENGANVHTAFKNANGGVGIFVRSKPITGAVQWGGHTYLLTERATNFWEAERQANLVGGHLVSIGSQAEQDFVFNTFLSRRGRTFWIGLAREYNGGPFQKWRSGERVAFSAWNRGEPNNWGGNEACTHVLDNNRWNDLPCHYALQGIIEIDNQNTFNCHRYVLTSGPLPFAEAEQEAIGMGGHLVAINDPEEMNFVESRFRAKLRQHLWIGLERPAPHQPFVRWTAGDKLDYTNWNPGEPNDWANNEACTHILSFSSKWNDIHCGQRFYGVVELPTISSCGISGGDESKAVVANPTATSLHWRLNGVVNDLSGNGAGAYLAGSVSWVTSAPAGERKFLSATPTLKFNSGAYPQAYNPKQNVPYLSGDASYTFMVWAYYDQQNWPSDWVGVFGTTPSDEHGNFNNGVGLAVYRGKPCMQFYGSEVRAKGPLATRKWYHIAGTKAAGSLSANTKVYVDGEAVDTRRFGPDAAPQIIAAVPVLGHSGSHTQRTLPSRYWNGYLKDARVYPSALPAESVKAIYNTEW